MALSYNSKHSDSSFSGKRRTECLDSSFSSCKSLSQRVVYGSNMAKPRAWSCGQPIVVNKFASLRCTLEFIDLSIPIRNFQHKQCELYMKNFSLLVHCNQHIKIFLHTFGLCHRIFPNVIICDIFHLNIFWSWICKKTRETS